MPAFAVGLVRMIREATHVDIPHLLEMGQRFADKGRLGDHVGFNRDDTANTFAWLIDDPHSVLFVGEQGMIAGNKQPHPFNYAHWIAQELFWWSEGREGLALLKSLEDWARDTCHSLRMLSLEAIEPERTGNLFKRRGFMLLEHGYIKVF